MLIRINPVILREIANKMDEMGDGCRCKFRDVNNQIVEFIRDDMIPETKTVYVEVSEQDTQASQQT
jgi:hypothetical protein